MCLLYIVFYYYTWLWKATKTLERKLNQTQTDAQQNPDILRMECKKHQSRMNVYAGSNDVLYWPYNRFLKEQLEFTSEFLVFFLFGEVQRLLDSILIVDFCYPSLVELYYGLTIPLGRGALAKNFCHAQQILVIKGWQGGEGGLSESVKKEKL